MERAEYTEYHRRGRRRSFSPSRGKCKLLARGDRSAKGRRFLPVLLAPRERPVSWRWDFTAGDPPVRGSRCRVFGPSTSTPLHPERISVGTLDHVEPRAKFISAEIMSARATSGFPGAADNFLVSRLSEENVAVWQIHSHGLLKQYNLFEPGTRGTWGRIHVRLPRLSLLIRACMFVRARAHR